MARTAGRAGGGPDGGHAAYACPLNGGFDGYQARCHDCDWEGIPHLRGDEELGTEESRVHKRNAKREAAEHRAATVPAGHLAGREARLNQEGGPPVGGRPEKATDEC